jgi:hypothetical protein
MWAFRVLENAISIILSDRVTHIFSLVKPLLARHYKDRLDFLR